MLESLWLPVLLSTFALFFASFLVWMALQLHNKDWQKVPNEAEVMEAFKKWNLPVGSYSFPFCSGSAEMKNPEFQKKHEEGPRGIVEILPLANMGKNLGFTVLYFLVVSFGMAYLASVAFTAGETFLNVFRFVFTASLFAFLASTIQRAIWFRGRLTGHIIESLLYSAITAAIFAGLWPGK